ncbi:MAG: peptide-methionine (S)-S-oxide reductase MsrA [Eggerthellaceae bacterium]|nr:peptide-methionine (S)-S-oxide reductase MsrA [Eggerthellaceae bacterium]
MDKKEIYLAGGCYWGVEKFVENLKGVLSTEVGFANGKTENPTYEDVCWRNTDHAETVKVEYDADVISLPVLLKLFYKIIDPTSIDRQGNDRGRQYRTGIYYTDPADEPVIKESLEKLSEEISAPVAIEYGPLKQFYPAEEYHQKYLDKNPGGYCHISWKMIDWAKTVDPSKIDA